ncbi:MAG TPA: hypothetical protein VLV78_16230 [Thermoanaerobaculia bacterium]|nr:hypothetical protein [Thermoanaerobaculia bacterium]
MISLLVILATGCDHATGRAERLIDRGELAEADRVLVAELTEHPTNLEAHFLLGKVRLLRNHPEDAAKEFGVVQASPDYRKRVAEVYWRTAGSRTAQGDPAMGVNCLRRAVQLDTDLAQPACIEGLTIARRLLVQGGDDVHDVVAGTAALDTHCRRKAISFVESAIRDSDRTLDPGFANSLAGTAMKIDPDASRLIAAAMRDRASSVSDRDPDTSLALLKNALAVDRSIDSDSETRALRAQFATRPPLASGVYGLQERLDPLDATLLAVSSVGWAVFAYAEDYGELPDANDIYALQRFIVPRYLTSMPTDGWGTALVYVHHGWQVRVISAGSDRNLTPQSTDLSVAPRGMLDPGGGDIIWEDGAIVQRPAEDMHLQGRPQ